ncbi:MAG TPA: S53 family peptidase [Ktedonobacterales bacterium]|nr:S53 family peptidase [Ktedonobacterales bacterium]
MVSTFSRTLLVIVACLVVSLSTTPTAASTPLRGLRDTHAADPPLGHAGALQYRLPATGGTTSRPLHLLQLSPRAAVSPSYLDGYSPKQIRGAYDIPANLTGAGITIAIVDAYHDPTAAADFDAFSTQFGLPTIAGGCQCFRQVDQNGGRHYPPIDESGWRGETSLDIEWAHAIAPGATILLVEAGSAPSGAGACSVDPSSLSDMLVAEDYATAHAQVVSNSWGCLEFSSEGSLDAHFNKPVAIVFAAGDSGSPAYYPSASPYVLSVGGTSLSIVGMAPSGGCTAGGCSWAGESVWVGGGGGASAYESEPAYQVGFCGTTAGVNACGGMRGTPDLSWMTGGSVGVAVYDSGAPGPYRGWGSAGGTSVGAPSVAGLVALADQAGHTVLTTNDLTTRWAYQVAASGSNYDSAYHDVTFGSNGVRCCSAAAGFDLASGLGSPVGASWITLAAVAWCTIPSPNGPQGTSCWMRRRHMMSG